MNRQPLAAVPDRRPRVNLDAPGRPPGEAGDPLHSLPQARFDPDQLFAKVRRLCAEVRDGHLRALLLGLLDDPELGPAFVRAPAAKSIHHAWLGGLCEHTLSILELGWRVCDHYPQLDRDLVTAGCLLHDFGKVRELSCDEGGFAYTDEGRLVGHLVITCQLVHERAAAIPGFPRELLMHLVHLVAAHHGSLEHGSPKEPQTLEALVVHALDELDSKMAAFGAIVSRDRTTGSFTEYQRLYDRHLFKLPSWNGEPRRPDPRRFAGPGLYQADDGCRGPRPARQIEVGALEADTFATPGAISPAGRSGFDPARPAPAAGTREG